MPERFQPFVVNNDNIEGIRANTAIRVIHSDGSVSWVFPNGLSNLGLRYREHSNDHQPR